MFHARSRVAGTVVAAALVAGFSLVPQVAGATTQTKFYDIALAPSPANAFVGVADTVTVTITNDTSSTQTFGSAELTFNSVPPSAVQVVQNLPTGWSGQVVNGTPAAVLITSQKGSPIQPGGSLQVQIKVTPTAAGTITILPEV